MDGVQAAIDAFNAADRRRTCAAPRSCSRTGRSRCTSTTRAPTASTSRPSTSVTRRSRRGRSTSPTTCSGAVAAAARAPSRRRSGTKRKTAQAPTARAVRPAGRAVPQPGPERDVSLSTARTPPRSRRTPATTHWYAGYESQSDNILDVDVTGDGDLARTSGPGTSSRRAGTTASSRRWSDGEWVTVPLSTTPAPRSPPTTTRTATTPRATGSPARRAASTSSTSRSTCTHRPAARRRDGRAVPLLDRRRLPRHRLVRRRRDGQRRRATVSARAEGEWFETTGVQDNNWTVQVVASCDLTPGVDSSVRDRRRRGQLRLPARGRRDHAGRLQHQVRERPEPRLRRRSSRTCRRVT